MTVKPKSIAIYGPGAIGLDMSVHLIEAGHNVSLIARGETKSKLQGRGIEYSSSDNQISISPDRFACTDSPRTLTKQDYVILTVKADALLDIREELPHLIGDHTIIVSATNGIPPWYSYLQDDTVCRYLKKSLPREQFLSCVPAAQIIGLIIERSVTREDGYRVFHNSGTGYVIGEPDHTTKERTVALKALLEDAGFTVQISDNIHRDIWVKLLGNIFVNPLSVMTEQTIGQMMGNPEVKARAISLVEEALEIGVRLGVLTRNDFSMNALIQRCEGRLAKHETSMLRDYKSGNPLELHRILEVVIMFADLPDMSYPVPALKSIRADLLEKLACRQ
ncbi:MAG: 2-dehydropantoate 2-reductase [Candidatus Obscuribacterales bacterium]|nr:2-dehydropantoate 2-reductase [Candidatus Obscuribacterales bacterium]